jgi:hypothetical protein
MFPAQPHQICFRPVTSWAGGDTKWAIDWQMRPDFNVLGGALDLKRHS